MAETESAKPASASRFRCPDPEATRAAGRALAACVPANGATISLIGPLGAGKTVFVKGLAEGLGVDPAAVSSPTFVIANQYAGTERMLAHVDLYRVQTAIELDDAGFVDLLEPGAVVAVEWGDRLPEALPPDRLELRFARDAASEDSRGLTASATGKDSRELLAAWMGRLAATAIEIEHVEQA